MRRRLWLCLIPILVVASCAPPIRRDWKAAVAANNVEAYDRFLRQHPEGSLAEDVRDRLEEFLAIARSIRFVSVSVDESYSADRTLDAINGVELPFASLTRELLEFAGVDVVGAAEDDDAVIVINVEGSALAQSYAVPDERHSIAATSPRTRQYSGARMAGTISLQTPALILHTRAFHGAKLPPDRIAQAIYKSASDAPFADLLRTTFGPELAGLVGTLYGFERLIEALGSANPVVRNSAAVALGRIREKREEAVVPLLKALETDGDILVRESAALSLGKIGDSSAVESLINSAHGEFDRNVRERAVTALGEIGDPRAIESLIELVGRDAQAVRVRAAEALRMITGEAFGPNADLWRQWRLSQTAADSSQIPAVVVP